MQENEERQWMKDRIGMTDAEIDEVYDELTREWLEHGQAVEAAAVGMQPAEYQAFLNNIEMSHNGDVNNERVDRLANEAARG